VSNLIILFYSTQRIMEVNVRLAEFQLTRGKNVVFIISALHL